MDHAGRCYCGRVSLTARSVQTIAYCHCQDCKRWTGAPLPAFVALAPGDLDVQPDLGPGMCFAPGVRRWSCTACGSPLAAEFDYLPGQIYVPLGLFDSLPPLAPALHCHAGEMAPWLHLCDDLPRQAGSAREFLTDAGHE